MKSFAVAVLMATLAAAWRPVRPEGIDAKMKFGSFKPDMNFPGHGFDIKDRVGGFANFRAGGGLDGVAALRGVANAGPRANFDNNSFMNNSTPSGFASPDNTAGFGDKSNVAAAAAGAATATDATRTGAKRFGDAVTFDAGDFVFDGPTAAARFGDNAGQGAAGVDFAAGAVADGTAANGATRAAGFARGGNFINGPNRLNGYADAAASIQAGAAAASQASRDGSAALNRDARYAGFAQFGTGFQNHVHQNHDHGRFAAAAGYGRVGPAPSTVGQVNYGVGFGNGIGQTVTYGASETYGVGTNGVGAVGYGGQVGFDQRDLGTYGGFGATSFNPDIHRQASHGYGQVGYSLGKTGFKARLGDFEKSGYDYQHGDYGMKGEQYGLQGINSLTGLKGVGGIQNNLGGINSLGGVKGLKGLHGLHGVQNNMANIQGLGGVQGIQGLQGVNNNLQGIRSLGGVESLNGLNGLQGVNNQLNGLNGLQGVEGLNGVKSLDGLNNDITVSGLKGVQGLGGLGGLNGIRGESFATQGDFDEMQQWGGVGYQSDNVGYGGDIGFNYNVGHYGGYGVNSNLSSGIGHNHDMTHGVENTHSHNVPHTHSLGYDGYGQIDATQGVHTSYGAYGSNGGFQAGDVNSDGGLRGQAPKNFGIRNDGVVYGTAFGRGHTRHYGHNRDGVEGFDGHGHGPVTSVAGYGRGYGGYGGYAHGSGLGKGYGHGHYGHNHGFAGYGRVQDDTAVFGKGMGEADVFGSKKFEW